MDDFVKSTLTEWGLSEWIAKFQYEEIDKECFLHLDERQTEKLITKMGPMLKFKRKLNEMKDDASAPKAAREDFVFREHAGASAEHEVEDDKLLLPSMINGSSPPHTSLRELSTPHLFAARWDADNASVASHDTPLNFAIGESCGASLNSGIKLMEEHGVEDRTLLLPSRIKVGPWDTHSSDAGRKNMFSMMEGMMESVCDKLDNQVKLLTFLKDKIDALQTKKRELVGVFGKTGAGKSSLINAILKEKDLLPSGKVSACTSAVIKVEGNLDSKQYVAVIEFINQEDWKYELDSMLHICQQGRIQDKDRSDFKKKLSALYQEQWRQKSTEDLMDDEKMKNEIPEFFQPDGKKTLKNNSASALSEELWKYTRASPKNPKDVTTLYWPLVKCVTIRVPQCPLLHHVTLVDLPGTGDHNKTRDKMWKGIIEECSTVWIVTELNRAASDSEAWRILEDACRLIGNGGECRQIHFICTKSDDSGNEDDEEISEAKMRSVIRAYNEETKEKVKEVFLDLDNTQKHFSDECFRVFTVSSHEFEKKKYLDPEDTEIPDLQNILRELNNDHSEKANYVSGALGILYLIEGANRTGLGPRKLDVCKQLEKNLEPQLDLVRKTMDDTCEMFERCLTQGVERSKCEIPKKLGSFLNPNDGRIHAQTLKAVVEKGGIHKLRDESEINLNATIASYLTDSINKEFRKTFPNGVIHGAFNGAISNFSLKPKELIQMYPDVGLQLQFLQTQEEQIKIKLDKDIRNHKKKIYKSLTESITEDMTKCYKDAASISGDGAQRKMIDRIHTYVHVLKDTMFERAKDNMMTRMRDLKHKVLETLESQMQKSIDVSLKGDDVSLPYLSKVKRYINIGPKGKGRSSCDPSASGAKQ